jgi:hypothetical protein
MKTKNTNLRYTASYRIRMTKVLIRVVILQNSTCKDWNAYLTTIAATKYCRRDASQQPAFVGIKKAKEIDLH